MRKRKRYTVSTYVFKSLKEAEKQIQKWSKEGGLNKASVVFEVSAMYRPTIKLVKVKDYTEKKKV